MSDSWKHAVSAFRRHAGLDGRPALAAEPAVNALFITCSESRELARLIAALNPASVLQTLGGMAPSSAEASDAPIADTVADAIERLGVTHIVVCGHARCRGVHDAHGMGALMKSMGIGLDDSQRHLLMQYSRVEDYLHGRRSRAAREVRVGALWVEPAEGDIYAYDRVGQRFLRCSDLGLEHWVAQLHGAGGVASVDAGAATEPATAA